jgi:hypothetical protein
MTTDAQAQRSPARDSRYLALRNFAISISVFNILGYTLFGFEQPWLWPLTRKVPLIVGWVGGFVLPARTDQPVARAAVQPEAVPA